MVRGAEGVGASVREWNGTGDSTILHESYTKEHLLSTPEPRLRI